MVNSFNTTHAKINLIWHKWNEIHLISPGWPSDLVKKESSILSSECHFWWFLMWLSLWHFTSLLSLSATSAHPWSPGPHWSCCKSPQCRVLCCQTHLYLSYGVEPIPVQHPPIFTNLSWPELSQEKNNISVSNWLTMMVSLFLPTLFLLVKHTRVITRQ